MFIFNLRKYLLRQIRASLKVKFEVGRVPALLSSEALDADDSGFEFGLIIRRPASETTPCRPVSFKARLITVEAWIIQCSTVSLVAIASTVR